MTPSPEHLQLLRQSVFQAGALPADEWNAFAACWHPVSFKRKALVTAAGEIERYTYFMIDGLQRAFYIDGNKEATLMFAYSGSFSGIIDSFFLQQPSRYYLEALTHCTCLRMSHASITTLIAGYPLLAGWIHTATVFAMSGVMERHMQWQTQSAEEKFRTLLTRSPHLLNMIPHKYLASYLGIGADTFSKLLGSVKLGQP
jgi:CRP-like cAMP-binding protein